MLTMRFVAVRDVLDPSRGLPEEEAGLGITTQGNNSSNAQWSIQVQHGGQRQRTRSIAITTKQKPGQESSQQSGEEEATVSSIWDEEFGIEDVEREETVEISLFCDLATTRNQGRTKLRHSSTSLEMRTFRGLPDQRVSLWLPLRSTAQDVDQSYGELHLSLTYCTDDCIVEGYLFGLFCGLAPPSLAPTWLTEIPFMGYASDASKTRTPSLRSSRSMPIEGRESSSSSSSQAGLGFVARSLSFPAFGARRREQVVNMRRKTGAACGTTPQGGIHVPLPMEKMGAL